MKYVKIISAGTDDSFDVVEKYIKKGIDYIYMERAEYEDFERGSLIALSEKYQKIKEDAPIEEVMEVVLDSVASIQDLVKNVGVSERTIESIENVVTMTEETISKNEKLEDLLKLLNSKEGYLKDHSYLTSYIACSIADRMSWQSEGIWKNIILSSLFQNISLEDNEEAKIVAMNSEEFKALSDSDKTKITMHPQDSVKLLEAASDYFPEDTRKMIQNHHEQPDGTGFPRGLDSTKVSLLEALFILSTNFARDLILSGSIEEVGILIQEYNERYNKSSYKRPYQGFLKAFTKLKVLEK